MRDRRCEPLDLDNGDAFDAWGDRDRAGRDAGAEPDDEDVARTGGKQVREVPEQPLQAEVLSLAGRLHLAGSVVHRRAARRA